MKIISESADVLIHCGLVILVNIGSGTGLLPDRMKLFPELMLTSF